MKTRKTLIRLHKWQADEKRKQLHELLALRDDLLCKSAALDANVLNEQAVVNTSRGSEADTGFAYATFARHAIQQRENIQKSVASIESRIAEAEILVAEAYKALKRHEIAAASQAEREMSEANRKEQIVEDDQALQSHARSRTTG